MDISDKTVPVRLTVKSLSFKVDLNLVLKVAIVVIASIGMQDLNLLSLVLKRVLLYVFERRVTHPDSIVILQIFFDCNIVNSSRKTLWLVFISPGRLPLASRCLFAFFLQLWVGISLGLRNSSLSLYFYYRNLALELALDMRRSAWRNESIVHDSEFLSKHLL